MVIPTRRKNDLTSRSLRGISASISVVLDTLMRWIGERANLFEFISTKGLLLSLFMPMNLRCSGRERRCDVVKLKV